MEKNRFSIELGKRIPRRGGSRPGDGSKSVIVMGDFSGRAYPTGPPGQTNHRLMEVTQETLDTLCARIGPALQLQAGVESPPLTIHFRCLEDFHPDNLCTQLRILNPEIIESDSANKEQRGQDAHPSPAAHESERNTLDRRLGKPSLAIEKQRAGEGGISSTKQSLIQDVVRRLADQANTPETTGQAESVVDHVSATSTLRTLLHAPEFKALESIWRSLDWLLRSIETNEKTICYLLDISRGALLHEIEEGGEVEDSSLWHTLQEQIAGDFGGGSDVLLIADFCFGSDPEDIQLLDALGQLVSRFGGALVAAADANTFEHLSDQALITAWQQFRRTPVSRQILLALPRVLLRLPYGEMTDPVDAFDFVELDDDQPDQLLWGNPAFACAIFMLQNAQGALAEPVSAIADMPAYSYRVDGEIHLQPCTEKQYSERQIDRFLSLGLVPVLGSHRSNIIQAPWLQSLAIDA